MITVSQLLDDWRNNRKIKDERPLAKAIKKLRKILFLLDQMAIAALFPNPDEDGWEIMYHVIFSANEEDIKMRVTRILEEVNLYFPEYCDPDTSYEADVKAWIEALRDRIDTMQSRLDESD